MEAKRESFIFHAEYIEGVPEELEAQYAMHAINYALKGIEPQLDDWRDQKMWNAIKTRIDTEAEQYEATVKARAAAGRNHKGNQYTRAKQIQTAPQEPDNSEMEQNGTKWNKTEQMELYMNLNMSMSLNLRMRVNLRPQRCRIRPLSLPQLTHKKYLTFSKPQDFQMHAGTFPAF